MDTPFKLWYLLALCLFNLLAVGLLIMGYMSMVISHQALDERLGDFDKRLQKVEPAPYDDFFEGR